MLTVEHQRECTKQIVLDLAWETVYAVKERGISISSSIERAHAHSYRNVQVGSEIDASAVLKSVPRIGNKGNREGERIKYESGMR